MRLQREDLGTVLQSTLAEKEAQYKRSLKTLQDSFESDKLRLAAVADREKATHDADIAQLKLQHWVDLEKVESGWKSKVARELLAAEEAHAAALALALADADAKHR